MYYNTTPNAFTLAIRMGLTRTESPRRWTWEANRGNPVGLNSNLTFGSDGNLVLTDATDGRVAWQTNTANKGVTCPNSAAKKYKIYSYSDHGIISSGTLDTVTLTVTPETTENYAYDINFDYTVKNQTTGGVAQYLARPKYNATLSLLRLGIDGNIRIFTYFDKVDVHRLGRMGGDIYTLR
ncbi:hypothetical protein QQ045_006768 [Rhodiola kirilowii]